jgi:hypothetical protein
MRTLVKPCASVDIGGEPLPLSQPSGLVLGGRQLGPGGLKLVDDVGALRALLDDPGHPGAVED